MIVTGEGWRRSEAPGSSVHFRDKDGHDRNEEVAAEEGKVRIAKAFQGRLLEDQRVRRTRKVSLYAQWRTGVSDSEGSDVARNKFAE